MKIKNLLIISLLILSIFLVACDFNPSDMIVCEKPYIRVGTECCLDANANKICDNDEQQKIGEGVPSPGIIPQESATQPVATQPVATTPVETTAPAEIVQVETTPEATTTGFTLTQSDETKEMSALDPDVQCLYDADCNSGVGYKCDMHKCVVSTTTTPTETTTTPVATTGPALSFGSIVQLTDFTDGNKREYASISGNGQKIIYKKHIKNPETGGGHWTLWVTDTSGSKQQTKIFDKGLQAASSLGSLSNTPILDYNAAYAYFAYERRANPKSGWADEVGMGRVKLSDNSFSGINLDISGYQKVDLGNFFVTSSKIYVSTRMWKVAEGVDPRDWAEAHGFMRMNLDGSNQETLATFTPAGADTSPYVGNKLFVDEASGKLYYEAYGGNYVLDMNTKQVSKMSVQDYGFIAFDNGKLISNKYGNVYVYDTATGAIKENIGGGAMQQRGAMNGIVYFSCFNRITNYCDGSFRMIDLEGNTKTIITKDTPQAENILSWEYQSSSSGTQISGDGKKIIMTNFHSTGTKNYYVLNLK